MTNVDKSLARLADHVAKRALDGNNTTFAETLDAFGKLITYYSALKKNKAPPEDNPDIPDFSAFQAALESHNGKPKVRGGGGPGGDE